MEPRFSVIIPSYNRAATLGRAIESVLHQSFPAFEVIVVDDGSTDQTRQLLESYPQVTYYYKENQGVSAARNKGAELSEGDWLIFLDSDDELMPDALEKFSKAINLDSGKKVFRSGLILQKGLNETSLYLSRNKYVGQIPGSFVIKRDFFLEIEGYDVQLKFAENTELFFRIEFKKVQPVHLEGLVLRYHQNPNGANNNLRNVTDSILWILVKHHGKLPKTIRRLYNQIVGVNYLRFRQFPKARVHLFRAYLLNPLKLDTLARLGIAMIPFLAKWLYSPVPPQK
ncbi:MAG: glycosyltransferase family 2 protein [Algoriphagus aquaeductus]|uniref:glycosyltransferase family 2 protein n=1 Tax=Algoriphagus aquaeductus TaxID=475299 RepID=UPI003879755B